MPGRMVVAGGNPVQSGSEPHLRPPFGTRCGPVEPRIWGVGLEDIQGKPLQAVTRDGVGLRPHPETQ